MGSVCVSVCEGRGNVMLIRLEFILPTPSLGLIGQSILLARKDRL